METTDLLNRIGFNYGLYKRHQKAKQYSKAQYYKGACAVLLEVVQKEGYQVSNDPHDLYNIILKDIRGF